MNSLNQYYQQPDAGRFSIAGKQGSDFAKKVAGDYNPIHDAGSKRFCVPGDLLFAIALEQYGLHEHMEFQFLDLVAADTVLTYPQKVQPDSGTLEITASNGKPVLGIDYKGACLSNADKVGQLMSKYVAFSGQNFPHILVPLMREHNVMINTKRPLVIYQSMHLDIDDLSFSELGVELGETTLSVDGKRGKAELHFAITSNGKQIGAGPKNLVLSGLREFDEAAINQLCEEFLAAIEG